MPQLKDREDGGKRQYQEQTDVSYDQSLERLLIARTSSMSTTNKLKT